MGWINCKPKIMFLNACIDFHNHSFECVLIIQCLYIFRIIVIMYVHTCSHKFKYVQFIVKNIFKSFRNPTSLITDLFIFCLKFIICQILYLRILQVYTYVISPISFYLVMCLYGPYNIDEHISEGHNTIAYSQAEYCGPLIVQYAILVSTYIYTSFILSYSLFYFT